MDEEKTIKQLKAELVDRGMPANDADAFTSKAQINAVLNTLKAKEEVKRVDTLEDKENPTEKKLFEKVYRSKAEKMRDLLNAQPKVAVMVPLQGSEKQGVVEWRTNKSGEKFQYVVSGSVETVQLNGCKWFIPKGVYYEVPQQISEIIQKSYFQTSQAGKDISLERLDSRTGRPMADAL